MIKEKIEILTTGKRVEITIRSSTSRLSLRHFESLWVSEKRTNVVRIVMTPKNRFDMSHRGRDSFSEARRHCSK